MLIVAKDRAGGRDTDDSKSAVPAVRILFCLEIWFGLFRRTAICIEIPKRECNFLTKLVITALICYSKRNEKAYLRIRNLGILHTQIRFE